VGSGAVCRALVPHTQSIAVWAISAATIAAIVVRPFRIGEWVWPVLGAGAIVAARLLPGATAARAAADGLDVYLFLAGMLALAELMRVNGAFDWLAANMLSGAAGNARRLFVWVYAAGILVTALLSNDGTIVLLTPAVLALSHRANLPKAPYLYACAFISNAASFVLPISNPANLVVFRRLPTLAPWLATFALPSLGAIVVTFAILYWLFRNELRGEIAVEPAVPLGADAKRALLFGGVSSALIVASAGLGLPVGRTAFACGAIGTLLASLIRSNTAARVLREGPWSIVPLVAGLFVIVQAVDETGILHAARIFLRNAGSLPAAWAHLATGGAVTIADNLLNNLPVGVLVRYALSDNGIATHVASAALIGVDLGPNLSLTGSLATLLWLLMLRREGVDVTAGNFLRIGVVVTVPALVLALLCLR